MPSEITPQLEQVRALLNDEFWLPSLNTRAAYVRFEDDSPDGTISVAFSDDGDGHITVLSTPSESGGSLSMRFRTSGPFGGGGQSHRVRNALLILAEAIRLDNEDHPQHRDIARKQQP